MSLDVTQLRELLNAATPGTELFRHNRNSDTGEWDGEGYINCSKAAADALNALWNQAPELLDELDTAHLLARDWLQAVHERDAALARVTVLETALRNLMESPGVVPITVGNARTYGEAFAAARTLLTEDAP